MGQTWSLTPHTSGLTAAEGGFETPLGWFGARWNLVSKAFEVTVSTPEGTEGVVNLPRPGRVMVDGKFVGKEKLKTRSGTTKVQTPDEEREPEEILDLPPCLPHEFKLGKKVLKVACHFFLQNSVHSLFSSFIASWSLQRTTRKMHQLKDKFAGAILSMR